MIRGLSQYRLLRRLGAGGQAEVYLAFDTRLKRRVCIKLYHLTGSLTSRRRAVVEARHLMRVESPQTITIHDVVSAGARLALVVQYVPGCTLKELLAQNHRLHPQNAVALVTDIAAALAALRQVGVVHGDIKPANVLITTGGRAVLTDFGASQLVGEQWSACSPEALSPEQSRGDSAAIASDFFSLGLLLYRMIYGVHPFFTGGELDIRQLRGGMRELPATSGLGALEDAALKELLLTLLAPEPEGRPTGTFELRERLRQLRSLLPAADWMGVPLSTESQAVPNGFSVARLPRKLVRLPVWQSANAGLIDYWSRGSLGARGLLVASMLLLGALLTAFVAMPGPCVAIAMPQINVLQDTKAPAQNEQELRVLLSLLLKERAKKAVVLGAGMASDSRYTLSAAGTHNACIAQRKLNLQVDCEFGRCLLQLQGFRDSQIQERQLSVPQGATAQEVKQALAQLVSEQRAFLMD